MKEIQVGLLGCGTVGSGVAKLLIDSLLWWSQAADPLM